MHGMHAQTNLQLYEQLRDRPTADRRQVRDAYEYAMVLFAGRYRADGRPFVTHLVGTASVLARHGCATQVILAGLMHAAYEQGDFGVRGDTRRALLRKVIGAEAEQLVADYTANTDRREVVLLRTANEIDECVYRGLLYVGPKKRAATTDRAIRFAAAAHAAGAEALARELEEELAKNAAEPDDLAAPRDTSFTITPSVRTVLRRRWRMFRRGPR